MRCTPLLFFIHISVLLLSLAVALSCTHEPSTPQKTLDIMVKAAGEDNQAVLDACFYPYEDFENGKLISTEEQIRRIQLRALTEVMLKKTVSYSIMEEKDIDQNTKKLFIKAVMIDLDGSTVDQEMSFQFIKHKGKWKLDILN